MEFDEIYRFIIRKPRQKVDDLMLLERRPSAIIDGRDSYWIFIRGRRPSAFCRNPGLEGCLRDLTHGSPHRAFAPSFLPQLRRPTLWPCDIVEFTDVKDLPIECRNAFWLVKIHERAPELCHRLRGVGGIV